EGQDVDLENAEIVQIVLVPFDHRAICHRSVLDRYELLQRPASHDETADVLGKMARKADKLCGKLEGLLEAWRLGIETEISYPVRPQSPIAPSPDGTGERRNRVGREPHRLAGLAQRGSAAIADHGGGEAGAFAPIFGIDVLDHLFTPLMLE